jgi:glycosyltransferase involved in cell wall biosynthesis
MGDGFSTRLTVVTVVKDDDMGFLRTAASLFQQINLSFEWVIIDGSRLSFASDFLAANAPAAIKITYIRENPQGIYPAMNSGWQSSSGEFIMYVNAGDFFVRSDATQVILSQLSDNIDVNAYVVVHVNTTNKVYAKSIPSIVTVGSNEKHAIMNHQGVVMKKSIFETLGGFDESFAFAADGKLLDESLKKYNFVLRDEILVAFSFGGASSQNHRRVWKEISRYRTITFSRFAIWIMYYKSSLRTFLFGSHSNWLFRILSEVFIARRMRRIVRENSDQFKLFDLL